MKEREGWRDERKTREINREIRGKEGKDEEREGRMEMEERKNLNNQDTLVEISKTLNYFK